MSFNGRYRVMLSFVEPKKAKGARGLDVPVNGTVALKGFDIHARARAPLTAIRE